MSERAAIPSLAPWGARLLERARLEPIWLGLLVGVALAAAMVGYEHSLGHVMPVLRGDAPTVALRAPVVALLLIGITPAAQLTLARWSLEHLRALSPFVGGAVPKAPPSARPSRRVGAISATLFVIFFVDLEIPIGEPGWLSFHSLYAFPMIGMLGWLMGRIGGSILEDSLLFSRLAARLGPIDLLDRAPQVPFVHQGLRSSLLMVMIIAITSVLALSPGERVAASTAALALSVSVAVAALLAPVAGLRRRIRAEKKRQLDELRLQIDAARRDVLAQTAATDAVVRLPGLLALEERIASVREWPYDTGNLVRFALYVLIGLGSWVGAAGVERLIDWSFD